MNLFRLVVNPRDFGQSVENLFYLSFLIRDGKCALDIDKGEPLICASSLPSPTPTLAFALTLMCGDADTNPPGVCSHIRAANRGRVRTGPAQAADGHGVRHGDMAGARSCPPQSHTWLTLPFTMQRAIEVFDITEPMIPQRPKSTMRIGGKWYG